jgi:alpha-L-arabinofuranosidase
MKLTRSSVLEMTRIQICQPLRLGLVLLVMTAAVLRAQLPAPTAWLTFNEGAGLVAHDSSGNGFNATLQGGAGWTTGNNQPYALNLPGSPGSYADIPTDVLDTTKSFTVAAWVKLNALPGYQTFVSEDSGYQSTFFLQKRGDTNTFTFTINLGAASGPGFTVFADSGITPVAGTWYHLAGVYDASNQSASVYVNGVLAGQVFSVSPSPANGHTGIGRSQYNNGYTDWNNGAIDDVRFYQQAISATDVLAIAQIGNPSLTGPQPVQPATLQIDAAHPGAQVNPKFYGMMTEEINHSYDRGLYGELIQNRDLNNPGPPTVYWTLVQTNGGIGSIALDTTQPVPGTVLTNSLKVTVTQGQRVGAANNGIWGIPVKPFTTYRASFWAKAAPGFSGPLTLDLESSDGSTVYARAQVPQITTSWAKYSVELRTFKVPSTENTQYVISTGSPGTFWLTQISLFRPTFNNRPNGNRIALMDLMKGLNPSFLRLPGGNYLEGNTIAQRFEWKNTIGPIEQRPGHQGPWGYWSDDGEGLLEFLEWCEDLQMQPLLAVYAGYSLNGTHVNPGPDLAPYVQDALDEIQYVSGGTNTTWGAQRAADGHPAPFPLEYVEIGNEDFFDASGSYDGRFAQFYDAIRAVYPNLKLIATTNVTSRTPDIYDQHFYESPGLFEANAHQFDSVSRTGPKIFVGEWASQEGIPTPNLHAALGDAAWLTGLERNSDLVILESYAPLLVNVNPGAFQWATNLIGFDALQAYGSPSYYMQAMFSNNHGNVVLPTTLTSTGGSKVYESVTRDDDGTIYLHLVNAAADPQPLHVTVNGVRHVVSTGTVVELTGSPSASNSPFLPALGNAYPVTTRVNGLDKSFDYRLHPYSVTVLQIRAQ